MKSLTIYSGHVLDNAYSCLLYLKKALEKNSHVTLWSDSVGNGELFDAECHTFRNMWYIKIPKARFVLKWFHVFFLMLFGDKTIIINDLDFFIPAYYAKKLRKTLKVIHYNTEIHGKDVKYYDFIEKFYEKHANFPDMIIECLEERAAYRKQKFQIKKDIFVINNTCTRSMIDGIITKEKIDTFINDEVINGRKVLVYAGSCEFGIDLDAVIDAVSKFDNLFFLCFCYGQEKSVRNLLQKCESTLEESQYKVYQSIDREKLLNVIYHYGDIGIVYYDPQKSVNYLYASPSKFFEYMAVGLQVLSTDNHGINRIINTNHMGECFQTEKDIERALSELLKVKESSKQEIRQLFEQKYCYEVDSQACIDEIMKYVNGGIS